MDFLEFFGRKKFPAQKIRKSHLGEETCTKISFDHEKLLFGNRWAHIWPWTTSKKSFLQEGAKADDVPRPSVTCLFMDILSKNAFFATFFSHTVPRSALSQTSTWKPLCFVNTKDSRKRKMRKICISYGHFGYFLWTFWLILLNFLDFLRKYSGPWPYSRPSVSKL